MFFTFIYVILILSEIFYLTNGTFDQSATYYQKAIDFLNKNPLFDGFVSLHTILKEHRNQ